MKKKFVVMLSALMLMAVPALSLAASTAGNNTVSSAAIIDGAVATADIANKAVTAAKIANAAITATQLADGAVTDAKITGIISTSKLNVGTSAGTIASGDHAHDGMYSKKYANVAVVAKNGGDYSSPVTAMSDLTSWCGIPSSMNPCLVKIMPGRYDIAANNVQMQQYVDLEGSGEKTTIISGTGGGQNFLNVIAGSSHAEIRNITIEAIGGISAGIVGVYSQGAPKLTNVSIFGTSTNMVQGLHFEPLDPQGGNVDLNNVKISLTGPWPTGIDIQTNAGSTLMASIKNVDIKLTADVDTSSLGILLHNLDGVINNVSITSVIHENSTNASGRGIIINESNLVLISNSKIKTEGVTAGSTGVQATSIQKVKIDSSSISAVWPILNSYSNIFVANTQLDGYVNNWRPGTIKCFGTYDGNYNAVTCP